MHIAGGKVDDITVLASRIVAKAKLCPAEPEPEDDAQKGEGSAEAKL